MSDVAGSVIERKAAGKDRRFFVALFLTALLLADSFWFKPLITVGVDPQKERACRTVKRGR